MSRAIAIRLVVAAGVLIGVTVLARSSGQQLPVLAEDQFARFDDRVHTYLDVRQAAVGAAELALRGAETVDAGEAGEMGEVSVVGPTLAAAIRRARGPVRTGDVFGRKVSDWIHAQVRSDLLSRSAAERADIFEDLPRVRRVGPNDGYPRGEPYATMPAALLERLPALPPPPLQYRLLGESLVLLDIDAGLVVDAVPHVPTGVV